ncbi:MAG: hypothetical protein K6T30_06055 [Alicyclobacillus sp.]|nr:hypothetical protein [Alicyclobacillus sp.]
MANLNLAGALSFDFTQMYPGLGIILFVLCGALVLAVEPGRCRALGLFREERWAWVIGWGCIGCGLVLLGATWVYNQFVW